MRTTSTTWRISCKVRLLLHVHVPPPLPAPVISVCPPISCLTGYNDTEQENNRECSVGKYFVQDDTEEQMKEACRFKRDVLSLCSGLSDTNFGYSEGRPCVLLKMNRVKAIVRLSVPACPGPCVLASFANLFANCRVTDHRPDAPRRPLHQLHNKGEQALRRRSSHALLVSFFVFFSHKFPLISRSFLPFFLFCLCLISFCMLSLTAVG